MTRPGRSLTLGLLLALTLTPAARGVTGPGAALAAENGGAPAAGHVRYVGPAGSDGNDGTRWGQEKATLVGAITSLAGQGGTVHVADGSWCSSDHTAGGLWVLGPGDPNYARPPAGWIRNANLKIHVVGLASATAGDANAYTGQHANLNCPGGIRISGHIGGVTLERVAVGVLTPVRHPLTIGVDSNGHRDNTALVTAGVTVRDSYLYTTSGAGSGPTIDVGGNTFWLRLLNTALVNTSSDPPAADTHQNVLLHSPSDPGIYLVEVRDGVWHQGGLRWYANTVSSGNIENVSQEDSSGPVVDLRRGGPYNTITIRHARNFDEVTGNVDVQTANGFSAAGVVCIGCRTGKVAGPMTLLAPDEGLAQTQTASPTGLGQMGFWKGIFTTRDDALNRVAGSSDAARRLGGPVSVRVRNLLDQDPASWGGSFRTGIGDPFGGTYAGRTSARSVTWSTQTGTSVSPGDWWLFGAWVRSQSLHFDIQPLASMTFTSPGNRFESGIHWVSAWPPNLGDGAWYWVASAGKVATAAVSPDTMTLRATLSAGVTSVDVAYPVFARIPARAGWSDTEVREFITHGAPWPSTASVGDVTFLGGQRVVIPGPGLVLGAGGTPLRRHLSATARLDFGVVGAAACVERTMTVKGAGDGDTVALGVPGALASSPGLTFGAYVSAADTVTVRACNARPVDSPRPPAALVRADVWQH